MSTSLLPSPPVGLKPRVCTHPVYGRSLGPAAVELGRRAGMVADQWQADALEILCGLREDGKWACFEYAEWVSRQCGKGTILELRALLGFLVLGEKLIVWSAHQYKTANRAFLRVKTLIRRLGTQPNPKNPDLWEISGVGPEPILVKFNNSHTEPGLTRLDTEAQIVFVARSSGSARGFTADLQIIDETFAYTMDQHAALLMTLSAVPNPQLIYTSSPPLSGDTGEMMYLLRLRGDPTAPRTAEDPPWEQDPGLGYRDWGAGSDLARYAADGIDLDDEALWRATNPAMPHRITVERTRTERRSIGPTEFARERCGIWPPLSKAATHLLDPKAWEAMADAPSRRHGDVVLMVDITPLQDHASIGLFGLREDGYEHVQLVDYRADATWVLARMVELHETLNPLCWVIDDKNGAAALLQDLSEAEYRRDGQVKTGIKVPDDPDKPHRGDILLLDAGDAAKSVAAFINAFKAGVLRHLGQSPLDDAVRNVKARTIGDQGQIGWARRASEIDIGPINSVTGARYGFYAWKDLVVPEYDPMANIW